MSVCIYIKGRKINIKQIEGVKLMSNLTITYQDCGDELKIGKCTSLKEAEEICMKYYKTNNFEELETFIIVSFSKALSKTKFCCLNIEDEYISYPYGVNCI